MSESTATAVMEEERSAGGNPVINDLTIHVATINGSGSQSSNSVLMRAIFQMGVPVSGKNLFPSNIAGLPTWFTIRANKHGWIARKREVDLLVCMNPQTAKEDVESLDSGSICVYDEKLECSKYRDDVVFYAVPFQTLAGQIATDARLKKLLANMIYVGVLTDILGIERDEVVAAIEKQFRGKKKAVDLNLQAIDVGIEFARTKLEKQSLRRLERMDATKGKIIIDGNSAAALGAIFGGLTVATWYPITPSSSLCEAIIDYANKYRVDEEGRSTIAVVQAEDELAAVGMVLGAGWAGARSMTSTSGPGISLMAEFAGLGYFAEIPGVIWNVQRVGPSTGLPTRTSQGDVSEVFYLSHGDTNQVALIPGSVSECFDFAGEALDLAERLQMPIFVLSDLDLGMNNWMSDPFDYPEKPFDRGKVLSKEKLEELGGKWSRYLDVDGDAIPWRTLPGTDHPDAAYFTRGSGHDEHARYTERPEDYKNLVDRLTRKYETAKRYVPKPIIVRSEGANVGIIAYGSTDFPMAEARHMLESEQKLQTSYLRLRALPFTNEVAEFIAAHDRVYVVEQNRDAQMADLLRLHVGEEQRKIREVLHYDGLPIHARMISDTIIEMEKEG